MRTPFIATLVFFLLLASVCISCSMNGSSSTQQPTRTSDPIASYFAALKASYDQVASHTQLNGTISPSSSWEENRRVLAQFASAVAEQMTALQAIEPPPELRELHDGFIKSFDTLDSDFQKMASSGSAFQAAIIFEDSQPDMRAFLDACRGLQKFASDHRITINIGCEGLAQRLQ